ncbi:MAG TPA: helix-turn-helix transcriptional regulator [Longimicrobiales bacterium]
MSPDSLPIKLRQARGAMSLAEAAEQSEIPEERIRMYEEGVRRPYGKTLRRLADVYGVRVAELVGSGQALAGRSRAPEVRRRRRRIVASAEEGAPIAVPLEVSEGQTVRLVIELVVRRRESEAPQDEVVEERPLARRPRLEEPSARVAEPQAARPLEAAAGGMVAPGAGGSDLGRRPRVLEEVSRQPLDPINELKRAYRDFRHKKK